VEKLVNFTTLILARLFLKRFILKYSKFLTVILAGFIVMVSANSWADVASVQKDLASIENSISKRKSILSSESAKAETESQSLKKSLRSTEKRLDRHQQKLERAEERLKFVNENLRELNAWYKGLGAIEQGLNGSTYQTKKTALDADHSTAESDLRDLKKEKTEMELSIKESNAQISVLDKKVQSSSTLINSDPQIKSLLIKKKQKESEFASLLSSQKAASKKVVPQGPVYKSYVYVISGKKSGEVEKTLKLKQWVESYQAKYIEANWNDLTAKSSSTSGSMLGLLSQMEKEFQNIPKDSKIILIGYGLGGGAAVLVATEVAAKINRDIDLLVTLDPMGVGESRMNAVYQTEAYCQGRISPEQYISCLSNAKKRVITGNVKSFYNRWQRESSFPIDAKDRMTVNKVEYVLATGKFLVANKSTEQNQKRVYYADKGAHELILSDAASELPKLLVPYLR